MCRRRFLASLNAPAGSCWGFSSSTPACSRCGCSDRGPWAVTTTALIWISVSWVMRSIVLYNLESGGAGQCAMDSALSSNDVVVLTSVSLGINLVVLWVTGGLQYVPTALKIGFDKVCARS